MQSRSSQDCYALSVRYWELILRVTGEELRSFLKDYEAKVIPLSKESALSYFNASITGKDSDYERSAKAQIALERIHSDTAAFAKVKAFRESGNITDPLLKRQLDIVYLSYLGKQIDMKTLEELINRQTVIEQRFNTYRVRVAGRKLSDNQVDSILKYSENSLELEETWKASKRIGNKVATEIIELVKLRNRAAQSVGFANYYEMKMSLGEQDPAEIVSLFDQLDSLTRGAFEVIKGEIDSALTSRYKVKRSQLQPWHYQNRFFQEAPRIYDANLDLFYRDKDPVTITRAYFAEIGIPVDSILVRSDLYEKPGKTMVLELKGNGDYSEITRDANADTVLFEESGTWSVDLENHIIFSVVIPYEQEDISFGYQLSNNNKTLKKWWIVCEGAGAD